MKEEVKKEIFHSDISTVTVFDGLALIRRTSKINVDKGKWDIVISPIPSKAKPETLRARIFSQKGSAKMLGLNYTEEYKSYKDLEEKKLLEKEIDYLESQTYDLQAKIELCDEKRQFLRSIKTRTINDAQFQMTADKPTPEDWQNSFDFVFHTEEKILNEEKDLREKLNEVNIKLGEKRKELDKKQTPSIQAYYFAHIYLDVQKAGNFTVSIDYIVDDAAWFPDYELRVNKGKEESFLTFSAIVHQNTGEDWTNAELFLSTAMPARELKIPQPQPWIIRGIQTETKEDENSEPAVLDTDVTEEGAAGIVLSVEQPVVIPATGEPVKVVILSEKEFPCKIIRKCLPQQSPNVYLYSETSNPFDFPILPGKVTIFHDNNYNGETRFPSIAPGEDFVLKAGIDEDADAAWKLSRKKKKVKEGIVTYKLTYKGILKNRNKTEIKAEIDLTLPVSHDKKIKISEPVITPKKYTQTLDSSVRITETIESNSVLECELSFELEYPKDFQIHGIKFF
ncbi:MAG: hypothetical protein DRP57_02710 [Spirochaetes bacterium]|nr:MAG: hypothetical protein DRP57_02710 [Spirochaetota bacterium]